MVQRELDFWKMHLSSKSGWNSIKHLFLFNCWILFFLPLSWICSWFPFPPIYEILCEDKASRSSNKLKILGSLIYWSFILLLSPKPASHPLNFPSFCLSNHSSFCLCMFPSIHPPSTPPSIDSPIYTPTYSFTHLLLHPSIHPLHSVSFTKCILNISYMQTY